MNDDFYKNNQNDEYKQPAQYTSTQQASPAAEYMAQPAQYETLSGYVSKTFLWMFAGLLVTFGVALWGYAGNWAYYIFSGASFMFYGLLIAEVVLVVWLSSQLHKMSVGLARVLFFAYATVNGIVFSSYFWLYDLGSMLLAFAAAAIYFGIMAGYGYLTKQDLSGWQKPLLFGLIAMLVVSVLGMFLNFGMFDIIISCVGIVIFACYTAYDTQKIKAFYFQTAGNPEMAQKASIFAALQLYLDFINMFLYILRLLGRRKN